jgi:hypothetical protein
VPNNTHFVYKNASCWIVIYVTVFICSRLNARLGANEVKELDKTRPSVLQNYSMWLTIDYVFVKLTPPIDRSAVVDVFKDLKQEKYIYKQCDKIGWKFAIWNQISQTYKYGLKYWFEPPLAEYVQVYE